MNDGQFIVLTTHRLEQRAQGVVFPPQTVFAIKDQALQRLANRVAKDPKLYTLLYRQYDLTLDQGEANLLGMEPTLLLSKESRSFWVIDMPDIPNSVKLLPSITDLRNPPPITSFYYAAVFQWKLLVRKSDKTIPTETAVSLYGNCVPLINDPVFDDAGELGDDLIDVAVELLLESSNPAKADQQAQKTS